MKTSLIVAGLAATALVQPAAAQTAPVQTAPAAAAQPLGGPVVAGVCLLSREAIFANAKVGLAATARLKELAQQAENEIEADSKPLQAEIQTLQSQRATLKPADLQKRQEGLAQKQQVVQQKAQQRNQELELTRQKALRQISDQTQPVIAQVYKTKNCGLLIDRNTVMGGNMSNDLTEAVVQGLDGKITTITFNRETLPAQAAKR
jgi:Skp family chaperone for outer membrane proteins